MPVINFQARFISPILMGSKSHTIRAIGKRPHRPGETLFMQIGPRFHPFRFAVRRVTRVREILLYTNTAIIWNEDNSGFVAPPLDRFAQCDGFADWADMQAWFASRLDARDCFHGQLIQWAPAEWEK